ncbi:MAG: aspartate aminotransferase family protein, partial [Chloroflexota bacterium]
MHKILSEDDAQIDKLLDKVVIEANRFLSDLDTQPAGAVMPPGIDAISIPEEGIGAHQTLELFKERYTPWMSGSVG